MCKYNVIISDTGVDSFLHVLFLSLALILSGLHEKPEGIKIEWQKKVHRRIYVSNDTFLTARPLFSATFSGFLHLLLPPSQVSYFLNVSYKDIKINIILLWMVFCVIISWVNGRKSENLLQFNTGWLASLRTWFILNFVFASVVMTLH